LLLLSLTPCEIGTKCCGIWCCTQGYECRSGECVASVEVKKRTHTGTAATTNDKSNSNNSSAIVGGVIGGVLGMNALVLCIILWRRHRGTPPSARPITPTSRPTNTRSLGGPPVTRAAQAGSRSQQSQQPPGWIDPLVTLVQAFICWALCGT